MHLINTKLKEKLIYKKENQNRFKKKKRYRETEHHLENSLTELVNQAGHMQHLITLMSNYSNF